MSMRHVVSISEAIQELPLPDGGSGEVYASLEGKYDEAGGVLSLTLESSLRPHGAAQSCARPVWLPPTQVLLERVPSDEATEFAHDVFRTWVERVRRSVPDDASLQAAVSSNHP